MRETLSRYVELCRACFSDVLVAHVVAAVMAD